MVNEIDILKNEENKVAENNINAEAESLHDYYSKYDMLSLYENDNSVLVLKKNSIYVLKKYTLDRSDLSVTICRGLQLELGRKLGDFVEALKFTRAPIVITKLAENQHVTLHNIVRMYTGKVKDQVLATVKCINGEIVAININSKLQKNKEFREYVRLGTLHQLTISYSLSGSRRRKYQLDKLFKAIYPNSKVIEIDEDGNGMIAIVDIGGNSLKFTFALDRNNINNMKFRVIAVGLNK